jgi:hypothetical protein
MLTIIIVVAVLLGALLLYAATKPGSCQFSRSIHISAPPERIFPLIDDLRAMNEWNPFVKAHLPRGKPGKPRVDDRTVISGILHVLKTGCRWRDVPPAYGPPTTIYNRYNRLSVASGSAFPRK